MPALLDWIAFVRRSKAGRLMRPASPALVCLAIGYQICGFCDDLTAAEVPLPMAAYETATTIQDHVAEELNRAVSLAVQRGGEWSERTLKSRKIDADFWTRSPYLGDPFPPEVVEVLKQDLTAFNDTQRLAVAAVLSRHDQHEAATKIYQKLVADYPEHHYLRLKLLQSLDLKASEDSREVLLDEQQQLRSDFLQKIAPVFDRWDVKRQTQFLTLIGKTLQNAKSDERANHYLLQMVQDYGEYSLWSKSPITNLYAEFDPLENWEVEQDAGKQPRWTKETARQENLQRRQQHDLLLQYLVVHSPRYAYEAFEYLNAANHYRPNHSQAQMHEWAIKSIQVSDDRRWEQDLSQYLFPEEDWKKIAIRKRLGLWMSPIQFLAIQHVGDTSDQSDVTFQETLRLVGTSRSATAVRIKQTATLEECDQAQFLPTAENYLQLVGPLFANKAKAEIISIWQRRKLTVSLESLFVPESDYQTGIATDAFIAGRYFVALVGCGQREQALRFFTTYSQSVGWNIDGANFSDEELDPQNAQSLFEFQDRFLHVAFIASIMFTPEYFSVANDLNWFADDEHVRSFVDDNLRDWLSYSPGLCFAGGKNAGFFDPLESFHPYQIDASEFDVSFMTSSAYLFAVSPKNWKPKLRELMSAEDQRHFGVAYANVFLNGYDRKKLAELVGRFSEEFRDLDFDHQTNIARYMAEPDYEFPRFEELDQFELSPEAQVGYQLVMSTFERHTRVVMDRRLAADENSWNADNVKTAIRDLYDILPRLRHATEEELWAILEWTEKHADKLSGRNWKATDATRIFISGLTEYIDYRRLKFHLNLQKQSLIELNEIRFMRHDYAMRGFFQKRIQQALVTSNDSVEAWLQFENEYRQELPVSDNGIYLHTCVLTEAAMSCDGLNLAQLKKWSFERLKKMPEDKMARMTATAFHLAATTGVPLDVRWKPEETKLPGYREAVRAESDDALLVLLSEILDAEGMPWTARWQFARCHLTYAETISTDSLGRSIQNLIEALVHGEQYSDSDLITICKRLQATDLSLVKQVWDRRLLEYLGKVEPSDAETADWLKQFVQWANDNLAD